VVRSFTTHALALDDAIEQGAFFCNMLQIPPPGPPREFGVAHQRWIGYV
jgi:hypothetical protein